MNLVVLNSVEKVLGARTADGLPIVSTNVVFADADLPMTIPVLLNNFSNLDTAISFTASHPSFSTLEYSLPTITGCSERS